MKFKNCTSKNGHNELVNYIEDGLNGSKEEKEKKKEKFFEMIKIDRAFAGIFYEIIKEKLPYDWKDYLNASTIQAFYLELLKRGSSPRAFWKEVFRLFKVPLPKIGYKSDNSFEAEVKKILVGYNNKNLNNNNCNTVAILSPDEKRSVEETYRKDYEFGLKLHSILPEKKLNDIKIYFN